MYHIDNEDELVDLVDAHDTVVETVWRSEANQQPEKYMQKGLYRRVVLAFLKDEQGRLCILRRSAQKSYLPLHWALVGGCVQSAESYEIAMAREMEEEVNLAMIAHQSSYLGYVTPVEHGGKYFKKIYELKVSNNVIPMNPNDFCEYKWLFAHELATFIKEDTDKFASDLLYLVQRFYSSTTSIAEKNISHELER